MPFVAACIDLISWASWIDSHTEWSESEWERQISYGITGMWNLKQGHKWTYLQDGSRVTDVENKLMGTGVYGGGINWKTKIDIYTLLYIK